MLDLIRSLAIPNTTKIVLLSLDGLGGLPRPETGRSELETARLPNLGALATEAACGLLRHVAPGVTPGSGPGHLGLFGYDPLAYQVVIGLTRDSATLLGPLETRMRALAAAERYEEAADARARASALARALQRQRQFDTLRALDRLELDSGEHRVVFRGGLLGPLAGVDAGPPDPGPTAPVPTHLADELGCVASWLDAEAARVRVVRCDGQLASPLPRLPRYEPARRPR